MYGKGRVYYSTLGYMEAHWDRRKCGLSIDAMIVQLQRLDIREIEMSRGEFMLFSKPARERFAAAGANFDAAGIRCVSYYTATIHDDAEVETAMRA